MAQENDDSCHAAKHSSELYSERGRGGDLIPSRGKEPNLIGMCDNGVDGATVQA